MTLSPLLEPVLDPTVMVAPPIEAGKVTGLNSRGRRRIIPITGGTVVGRLQGRVLPGGADFRLVTSDTCTELDARYLLQLDDPGWAGAHLRGLAPGAGLADPEPVRRPRRALSRPGGDAFLPRRPRG